MQGKVEEGSWGQVVLVAPFGVRGISGWTNHFFVFPSSARGREVGGLQSPGTPRGK